MRSNPNYDVIKEPRGFIKCLEVFLAIFAFACATGFSGNLSIVQTGSAGISHEGEFTFKYPFDKNIEIWLLRNGSDASSGETAVSSLNERSKMEFFVVIGVFCFLYSLAMVIFYVFFEEDNSRNAAASSSMMSPPVIDFVFGAFWCLFWFFSACAFAAGVHSIKGSADLKELTAKGGAFNMYCRDGIECAVTNAKYATLTVAILLGFLNVFVWFGNIWFLWKETPWHNKNAQPATIPPQQAPAPPAAAI